MENKLFTVIIPTYNRCELLSNSLERIAPVVSQYSDLVSIYVSDNCSNDGTGDAVKKLSAKYKCIEYFCQDRNIGATNNFLDSVQRVTSKYVALISDDDVVLPNYIPSVLDILSKYPNIALVNVNMLCSNYSYSKFTGLRDFHSSQGDVLYYENGGELIKVHLEIPSLISSNVFERAAFIRELNKNRELDYPGYEWLAILYYSIVNRSCIYYDLPLLVQLEPNNQRWEQDIPWYYIYGFGKLFEDLDKEFNGIKSSWEKRFSGYTQFWLFKYVNQYKEEYQDRWKKMEKYLPSMREKIMLRMAVNGPLLFLRLADLIFKLVQK